MVYPLLIVVTAIYWGVAIASLLSRDWPLGIMYAGYAFANLGPIMLVDR